MAEGGLGLSRRPLLAGAALAALGTAAALAARRLSVGDGVPALRVGALATLPVLPALASPLQTIELAPQPARTWLLKLWASWCAPCRDEHPLLHDIAAAWPQLPLVGLAYRDDPRDAQEWLLRHGNPYRRVAFDHGGDAARDWGAPGLPATFLIDGEGIVRWMHRGGLSPALWQREAALLLSRLVAAPDAALES